MTKIKDVICAPGLTGFYFDDQKAVKAGAKTDGGFYQGTPVTPGFTKSDKPERASPSCSAWMTDRLLMATAPQ